MCSARQLEHWILRGRHKDVCRRQRNSRSHIRFEAICGLSTDGRVHEESGIFNFDLFEEPDWKRLAIGVRTG